MSVISDLRFNHSDMTITTTISFPCTHCSFYSYLVFVISVFYTIKFCIFMLSKHSFDESKIGHEGGVALGEALKVNKTLQTLK